jgi:hypothetical protein
MIHRKYGFTYRVVMGIERLIKFGSQKRVTLRITRG